MGNIDYQIEVFKLLLSKLLRWKNFSYRCMDGFIISLNQIFGIGIIFFCKPQNFDGYTMGHIIIKLSTQIFLAWVVLGSNNRNIVFLR